MIGSIGGVGSTSHYAAASQASMVSPVKSAPVKSGGNEEATESSAEKLLEVSAGEEGSKVNVMA